MLPMPIFVAAVFSIDLLRNLVQEFECYLVLFLQMNIFTTMIILCPDTRSVFWVCFLPSMLVSTFMDAYPSKWRPVFSRMFFLGIGFVYLLWLGILCFGWGLPVEDAPWTFFNFEGRIASSTVTPIVT